MGPICGRAVTPRDIQTSNFDIRISPLVKFTTTKDKFVKPAFTNNTQMQYLEWSIPWGYVLFLAFFCCMLPFKENIFISPCLFKMNNYSLL